MSVELMDGDSSTQHLVDQFFCRTLPKSAWTHQAHLRVGLWHVLHFGPEEALTRLRTGIRALNESHGTLNTDSGGYHETITRFYVCWIANYLARAGRNRPLDELADELVQAAGDSQLPLRYYSRDRLYSVEARRSWVEPDLQPLP
jgi:hypothetical protein